MRARVHRTFLLCLLCADFVPMVNAEQQHFENKDSLRRINHAVAGYLNTLSQHKVKGGREAFPPEFCVLGGLLA